VSRRQLAAARRAVVKIGSRLLSEGAEARVVELVAEIAALRARGVECVLVSSGAIALGMSRLELEERPRAIPLLQATAAVGQGHLMQHYDRAFAQHGLAAGQVLLTHDDLADRARFLNARHALGGLLGYGAVPVINENDTVAVEEIKFGDNDQLAALTTNLVEAEALVILTDVAGLLDAQGQVVPEVTDIDGQAVPLAGGATSGGVGRGGMASKVQAARVAGRFGVPTVVAPGREPRVLERVLSGEPIGTLFQPTARAERLGSRKHWIAYALKPAGSLQVDEGARRALVEGKRSLLPSGIRAVNGRFGLGEAVSVLDPEGAEFARGLAGYSADEIERIRGRKTADIEAILGYKYFDEVIHRDDLVVL
jgi:glutamate 5-kinase